MKKIFTNLHNLGKYLRLLSQFYTLSLPFYSNSNFAMCKIIITRGLLLNGFLCSQMNYTKYPIIFSAKERPLCQISLWTESTALAVVSPLKDIEKRIKPTLQLSLVINLPPGRIIKLASHLMESSLRKRRIEKEERQQC